MNRHPGRHGRLAADVVGNVRAHAGRNLLAFIAIAIGAATLAVIMAILHGLSDASGNIVEELGGNVVAVQALETPDGSPRALLQKLDIALLEAGIPGARVTGARHLTFSNRGGSTTFSIIACDAQLLEIRKWQLVNGRRLDAHDVSSHERNAVAEVSLARAHGWAVGDTVMLERTPFRLVGIIAAQDLGGSEPRLSATGALLVPHTALPFLTSVPGTLNRGFDTLYLQYTQQADAARVVSAARRLLERPGETRALRWVTADALIAGIRRLQWLLGTSIGSIAALSLLMGGATLMSLMIANVRERQVEIGLRRAVGATRRDIITLFVAEAVLISLIGTVIGTLAGHLALLAFDGILDMPAQPGVPSLLLPTFMGVGVAVAFTCAPARAAAQISPALALRSE